MLYMLLLLVLLIPLLAVVLDSSIARALAKRLEGSAPSELTPDEIRRLKGLQNEVDRLSDEVARLQEQGEFLQRLLEERPRRDALPPGESPEPHA